jgi:hypothetical protein
MYPLTFYVDSLPDDAAGVAQGPIIRILKSHKDDVGLYHHELTHVKQWFLTFGLHSFLYLLFDFYKLQSEVEAYKVQLEHSPGREALFAKFIAEDYDLDITQAEALELLK